MIIAMSAELKINHLYQIHETENMRAPSLDGPHKGIYTDTVMAQKAGRALIRQFFKDKDIFVILSCKNDVKEFEGEALITEYKILFNGGIFYIFHWTGIVQGTDCTKNFRSILKEFEE